MCAPKVKQTVYNINRFVEYGAGPVLTKQLFSSFIKSYLFYCLIILYNYFYATDRPHCEYPLWARCQSWHRTPRAPANSHSATKKFTTQLLPAVRHFIHSFTHPPPSGNLQSYKYKWAARGLIFSRAFYTHCKQYFQMLLLITRPKVVFLCIFLPSNIFIMFIMPTLSSLFSKVITKTIKSSLK